MSSSEGIKFKTAANMIANFVKGPPSWTEDDDFYHLEGKNVITPIEKKLSDLTPKRSNDSAVLDFLAVVAQEDESWKQCIDSEKYMEQIDTSIWAKSADGTISGNRWKDPPLEMEDICHVLSTSAFAIPGGAEWSAGISLGSKYLIQSAQEQTNLFQDAVEHLFSAKELNRVSNPYDSLETWISQDVDEGFLNETVEPVRGMANALVERLNQYIYTKSELDRDEDLFKRVTSSMVYKKACTIIALKSKMSKQSILHGAEGLDIVFQLMKDPRWLIIVGGESSFSGTNISQGLANNPSKTAATYAIFVSVSVTIQKALQVYAWLALLPEKAFGNDSWDGTVCVEETNDQLQKIKVQKDFDICEALYQSKDNNNSDSAWTILEQFATQTLSPSSSFMRRYDDGRKIWNIFLNRMLSVHFKDNQSPKRNEKWYYAPDGSAKRQYNLDDFSPVTYSCKSKHAKDKFFNDNVSKNMNLDNILTEETQGQHQIIMLDSALNNNEHALDSVANNFHTQLKLSLWFAPNCPPKPKNPIDWVNWATTTKPINAAERGIIIEHFHKGVHPDYTKYYTFPLVASANSSNGTTEESYSDVFWVTSKERPSKSTGAFMKSDEGRWTIGWLGLVLSNYAQAYGIRFDVEQQTNTFLAAEAALRIQKANAKHITTVLDYVQGHYERN